MNLSLRSQKSLGVREPRARGDDLYRLEALQKHERHLASILENSADAIVSLDLDRVVLSWNKAATRLFGYAEEEMIGNSANVIVPKERLEAGEIEHMRAETQSRGLMKNFETIRLTKGGTAIYVSISQNPLRSENGEIYGYSVIYRDITEQKRWEKELHSRFEKMQNAYIEMGRQRRYIDYLEELLEIVQGKAQFADVMSYIANAFAIIGHVDIAALYRYDEKQHRLALQAVSGASGDFLDEKEVALRGTLLEESLRSKKPLKIADIRSETRLPLFALAQKHDLRSLHFIPLRFKKDVLGAVMLCVKSGNSPATFDNEFTLVFAEQVALVLRLLQKEGL